MTLGINAINVRFFAYTTDTPDGGADIIEIPEADFVTLGGRITYERNTVFANGCRQICLHTDAYVDE